MGNRPLLVHRPPGNITADARLCGPPERMLPWLLQRSCSATPVGWFIEKRSAGLSHAITMRQPHVVVTWHVVLVTPCLLASLSSSLSPIFCKDPYYDTVLANDTFCVTSTFPGIPRPVLFRFSGGTRYARSHMRLAAGRLTMRKDILNDEVELFFDAFPSPSYDSGIRSVDGSLGRLSNRTRRYLHTRKFR